MQMIDADSGKSRICSGFHMNTSNSQDSQVYFFRVYST